MSEGLVVASNRGPVAWEQGEDGRPAPRRGFGGLVTALGGALQDEPGAWVSVALSDVDREVAASHEGKAFEVTADGSHYRLRLIDAGDRFEPYYNEVANRLLWFALHRLWVDPYSPSGESWREAWADYRSVNDQVAQGVVEAVESSATEVYLQDYHLCLAGPAVRETFPDAALLHYLHTPWTDLDALQRLPDTIAEAVLRGLLAADVVGFSSPVWCRAFRACAAELLGARIEGDTVLLDGRRTLVESFVLGVDADDLAHSAASEPVAEAAAELDAALDGRKLVVRVDRTDLSKNILRGLRAYRLLLERHPEHRGRVWHYAHLNPSRQEVPEYQEYLARCLAEAEGIRERFGEDALEVFVGDDYPRAVAALQRSDVLLANPVKDGTNLVAKEGPTLNERDGVLVLSRDAGATAVLAAGALVVNPYDVEAQADALHDALTMSAGERAVRAARLREAALRGSPSEWFRAQRRVLRGMVSSRSGRAAG
ncbi:MAG: alpha,alpha-trehalose-phosphate synthase (UDP-forming) [Egibacteraceae bacterium]